MTNPRTVHYLGGVNHSMVNLVGAPAGAEAAQGPPRVGGYARLPRSRGEEEDGSWGVL